MEKQEKDKEEAEKQRKLEALGMLQLAHVRSGKTESDQTPSLTIGTCPFACYVTSANEDREEDRIYLGEFAYSPEKK